MTLELSTDDLISFIVRCVEFTDLAAGEELQIGDRDAIEIIVAAPGPVEPTDSPSVSEQVEAALRQALRTARADALREAAEVAVRHHRAIVEQQRRDVAAGRDEFDAICGNTEAKIAALTIAVGISALINKEPPHG